MTTLSTIKLTAFATGFAALLAITFNAPAASATEICTYEAGGKCYSWRKVGPYDEALRKIRDAGDKVIQVGQDLQGKGKDIKRTGPGGKQTGATGQAPTVRSLAVTSGATLQRGPMVISRGSMTTSRGRR